MANNVVGRVGNAFTVLASAARTTTPDSQEFTLPSGARNLMVTVDATAHAATPSVVFKIEGVDPVSGNTFPLLSSVAVTAANTATAVLSLSVGPGITAANNVAAAVPLPSRVRITATHGDADSITYSVGAYVS